MTIRWPKITNNSNKKIESRVHISAARPTTWVTSTSAWALVQTATTQRPATSAASTAWVAWKSTCPRVPLWTASRRRCRRFGPSFAGSSAATTTVSRSCSGVSACRIPAPVEMSKRSSKPSWPIPWPRRISRWPRRSGKAIVTGTRRCRWTRTRSLTCELKCFLLVYSFNFKNFSRMRINDEK